MFFLRFFQGVEGVIFDGHELHHVERAPDAALHADIENPHYLYSTLHAAPHATNRNGGNSSQSEPDIISLFFSSLSPL